MSSLSRFEMNPPPPPGPPSAWESARRRQSLHNTHNVTRFGPTPHTTHLKFLRSIRTAGLHRQIGPLVPAPRVHLTRFHRILGPAAKWRPLIVPQPLAEPDVLPNAVELVSPAPADITAPIGSEASGKDPPLHRNYAWARLMMRVFKLDVLKCERCGARLRILAAIHPPDTTTKILDCLGLPSRAPPLAPAVSDFNCQTDPF